MYKTGVGLTYYSGYAIMSIIARFRRFCLENNSRYFSNNRSTLRSDCLKKINKLVVTNVIMCMLLVAEIALLAINLGMPAGVMAAFAALASVLWHLARPCNETKIAMICCTGYVLAIVGGLLVETRFPGHGVDFGLFFGGVTIIAQIVLSLTRDEGKT